MINNKWFCEPDPYREKYCFFYLETKNKDSNESIKLWKSGIGNLNSISCQDQSEQEDEKDVIKSLIHHVKDWRRKNILMITDSEKTIPILRTRIAAYDIDEIILSTINSVSLEHLINKYMSCPTDINIQYICNLFHINTEKNNEPELIRKIFQKIIKLIPSEEIA